MGASTYLVAGLLPRGIVFLLLPFLARSVTPANFGRVTIAITVAGLAAVVMGLGLETPVFRIWYSHPNPRDRDEYLRAARSMLAISTVSVGLLVAVASWLVPVPTDVWEPELIVLAVAGAVATALVTNYVLPVLRAQERLREYLQVQLSNGIAYPLLLGIVVFAFDLGALGWVASAAVAAWFALIVGGLGRNLAGASQHSSARRRRDLLRLGLPLVPHALSHWALTGADRLVLTGFVSAAAVGVYGLSYRVAQVVALVLTEVNRALMNEYARVVGHGAGRNAERQLGGLAELQIAAAIAAAFSLGVLGPPVFLLLFPPEFAEGAAVLPWVAVGYGFFGVYFVPTQLLVIIEGQSRWLWLGTASGAAVNLLANFMLIPSFGIHGAAAATTVGYGVMLVVVSAYARRTVSIHLPIRGGRLLVLACLAGATGVASILVTGTTLWVTVVLGTVAVWLASVRVALSALRDVHDAQILAASDA